jgi:hypothetical protein
VRKALRAKKASLMRPAKIAATNVTRTSKASRYELPSSLRRQLGSISGSASYRTATKPRSVRARIVSGGLPGHGKRR